MQKRRVLYVYGDAIKVGSNRYLPHVFEALRCIERETELELVLLEGKLALEESEIGTLRGEDIYFEDAIDESELDIENSFVAGREGDELIFAGRTEGIEKARRFSSWLDISSLLVPDKSLAHRRAKLERNTRETQISLSIDLDGSGKGLLRTGVGFFDHMLEQVVKHSRCDIEGKVAGDLEVDEHHTVEDLGICLGLAFKEALGDKRGINRYGHDILIMDDVICTCAIDFSGRPYLLWKVDFRREEVGGFPTEMFQHFFKSFSDAAQCNLSIEVSEGNTHHQAEAIFKAFARAAKMAVRRIPGSRELPSTKGVL